MSELSVAARVVEAAAERGLRIAVAESLTGGLLADALVTVPGTSAVFTGAIVAYDAELKRTLLGVDAELLGKHGPVHPEVAEQMALGVRRACAVGEPADIGIATTGVAGPDPDPQTGQPPGTVWIGVSARGVERAIPASISPGGSREDIRKQSVQAALEALLRAIVIET